MRASTLFFPLAALALLGCTADEETYDYAAPSELCGLNIDPGLLQPLLPPGKTLAQSSEGSYEGYDICTVTVDSSQALNVGVSFSDEYRDPMQRTTLADSRREEKIETRVQGEEAVLWATGVNISFLCEPREEAKYTVLRLTAQQHSGPSEPERRERIEAFAENLATAVKQEHGCSS
ncbi:hypothetical protein PJ985_12670 [Streptomyces sp. ACA25]|uniref:hypothetical protein n=1 Tax=Streptomyces sp. ACA25 TaxID=3022596 RepID=UPI0023075D1D|nr:hypothetical protein [Streptomyces sp. ACA25]MDB1088418.1 hypothetical protein [Streptomyces sp. ACA25]